MFSAARPPPAAAPGSGPDDDALRPLDRRGPVLALFVLLLAVFAGGEWLSAAPYGSAAFVIGYAGTEAVAGVALALLTARWLPWRRLGWRRPQPLSRLALLPMVLLLAVALGAWWQVRQAVPEATAGTADGWRVLRTTVLVGLNEEWLFRGLVLVTLTRWWGARPGRFGALALFGAFHLLNIASGVPPALALLQFGITALVGAVLLLAALGGRSLWPPVVAHALYDFAVIDLARLQQGGAPGGPQTWVLATGLVLGLLSLVALWRWPGGEPYPDSAPLSASPRS